MSTACIFVPMKYHTTEAETPGQGLKFLIQVLTNGEKYTILQQTTNTTATPIYLKDAVVLCGQYYGDKQPSDTKFMVFVGKEWELLKTFERKLSLLTKDPAGNGISYKVLAPILYKSKSNKTDLECFAHFILPTTALTTTSLTTNDEKKPTSSNVLSTKKDEKKVAAVSTKDDKKFEKNSEMTIPKLVTEYYRRFPDLRIKKVGIEDLLETCKEYYGDDNPSESKFVIFSNQEWKSLDKFRASKVVEYNKQFLTVPAKHVLRKHVMRNVIMENFANAAMGLKPLSIRAYVQNNFKHEIIYFDKKQVSKAYLDTVVLTQEQWNDRSLYERFLHHLNTWPHVSNLRFSIQLQHSNKKMIATDVANPNTKSSTILDNDKFVEIVKSCLRPIVSFESGGVMYLGPFSLSEMGFSTPDGSSLHNNSFSILKKFKP